MSHTTSSASASGPSPTDPPPAPPDPECTIRFRLTDIDTETSFRPTCPYAHTASPFYRYVDGQLMRLESVPVIRLFGATDRGQRVVAHVHGAFPYLYVRYKGKLDPECVNSFIIRFGRKLNQAIALSFPARTQDPDKPKRPSQHVGFIVVCKGVPFYGFAVGYEVFLKVYFVQPSLKKRAAELLRAGAVLNTKYDVFEDHIPYLFQFQLDCNLRGCGWVEVGPCKFRELPPPEESHSLLAPGEVATCTGPYAFRIYDSSTVPASHRYAVEARKDSTCTLELDMPISSILNRHRIQQRKLHDNFHEKLHPSQSTDQPKLVNSLQELWEDEARRRKRQGRPPPASAPKGEYGPPRAHDTFTRAEKNWRNTDELAPKLNERFEEDLREYRRVLGALNRVPGFESWASDYATMQAREAGYADASGWKAWMDRIKTTFEQTDAIFGTRFVEDENKADPFGVWAVRGVGLNAWDQLPPGADAQERPAQDEREVEEETSEDDLNLDLIQATQVQLADAYSATQSAKRERERVASRTGELAAFAEVDEDEDDPDEQATQQAMREEDDDALQIREEERVKLGQVPEEDEDEAYWFGLNDQDWPADEEILDAERSERARIGSVEAVTPSKRLASERAQSVALEVPADRPTKQLRTTRSNSSTSVARPSASPAPGTPTRSPSKRNKFSSPEKKLRISMPLNPMAAPPPSIDYGPLLEMSQIGSPSKPLAEEAPAKRNAPSSSPEKEDLDEGDKSLDELAQDEVDRMLEDGVADAFEDDLQLSPTQVEPQRESSHRQRSPSPLDNKRVNTPLQQVPEVGKQKKMVAFRDPTRVQLTSPRQPSAANVRSPPSSAFTFSSPRPATQYPLSARAFTWAEPPPSAQHLLMTIKDRVSYVDPFYSRDSDVPSRHFEFGGKRYLLLGNSLKYLPEFETGLRPKKSAFEKTARRARKTSAWEWAEKPLSPREAKRWLDREAEGAEKNSKRARKATAIEGPTQANGGFKVVSARGANITRERQHMQILSVELHINTRGSLYPDPTQDAVCALFYCLKSETDGIDYNACDPSGMKDRHTGVVIVGDPSAAKALGGSAYAVETVADEWDLLQWLVDKVQREWDPECVTGYEVNKGSWGYLVERARIHHDYDLVDELSRIPRNRTLRPGDQLGRSKLKFVGRHVLPIWSLLRADNKLQQYSFEHVVYHILRQRTPHFSHETLTKWYTKGWHWQRADVFAYWFARVQMNIDLLDESDIVNQASESARVFGVDFNSVRTRGSQFKVEAFMLRIAKPESFLLFSPNRAQVGRQAAVEATPLVMEPESDYYKGPMVVLDFTSLYPSIMCAYNLCYSTCLGRVRHTDRSPNLGVLDYDAPPGLLATIKDDVTISPNGFIFVKKDVRKSLLAKMLEELLESRVMVKASMKGVEDDVPLTKLLNARQLALKFIANVTYGYTTATASGRMPMVELADAIVQTGRETLERARDIIHSRPETWGAKVVYGDTDSLFIYLPGKSKADAFRIGHEMAAEVTSQNPRPVQLKFEKVYLPSVLLAKKRYVGFKYERESDKTPEFDAKGIETVRRDGIAATQKMQEMTLKLLFRSADLSQVKLYCQRQWAKIISGEVSPQDFIVAKEVRLGSYSDKGLPPPGAALAARQMKEDPRAEPEYGDRVPYILVEAEPGTRQVDRAVSPHEFLADPRMRLDATHYITKMIIPPLNRIFTLIGVRLETWYDEMRKSQRTTLPTATSPSKKKELGKAHITQHFTTTRCLHCGGPEGHGALCTNCTAKPGEVALHLNWQTRETLRREKDLRRICASCSGAKVGEQAEECDSEDCPVLYDRTATRHEVGRQEALRKVLEEIKD